MGRDKAAGKSYNLHARSMVRLEAGRAKLET